MNAREGSSCPRPTTEARRIDLEELLHDVRRELARRVEDPTGEWVETTSGELVTGEKPGWYLPGGGLAFYARRGSSAFGHLHVQGEAASARQLATMMLDHLPTDLRSIDVGFTGLSGDDERSLARELGRRPGSTVIDRQAMERPLSPADGHLAAEPPAGVDRVPVGAVTLEALAELDRAAFRGSVDELLLGDEPQANRRAIEAILESRLGRFLGEASTALLESEPTRLVGVVMSAERSSRTAIVLALMVDPERRRKGWGRFLLGWTVRALWALGYERVRLWVSVRNAAAVELYREFGFRTVLEAAIYRWDHPVAAAQPQRSR